MMMTNPPVSVAIKTDFKPPASQMQAIYADFMMKRVVENMSEWWGRQHPLKILSNMAVGWLRRFKVIKTPKDIAVLSNYRLAVCSLCKFSAHSRIVEIINGSLRDTDSLICTKCKCPCLEKSLVLNEKCPIDKW
jgi:hypothetical protein